MDLGARAARSRAAVRRNQVAAEQRCDDRRQRGCRACKRPHLRGGLHQALHVARLDRAVLRGRRIQGRQDDGVDAFPGRLPAARRARQGAENAGRGAALRACGRVGLLRAQRRRRRGGRCRALGPRAARPAGAPAMDARRRVRLGALWPGHGDAGESGARRRRQDCRLGLRGVEQYPFDAAAIHQRHQRARRLVSRRAAENGAAYECAAARRRRGSQRHTVLRLPAAAGDPPFRPRHADPGVGAAHARRLRQRIRARILHGRAGGRSRRRPSRLPARTSQRPARTGGDRGGRQESRLDRR